MSLDVALTGPGTDVECTCQCCGHKHTRKDREFLYEANITHNLGSMARVAGIYECLWHPEKAGIIKARYLIEPLWNGLERLRAEPERFKKLNPPNGWGAYEDLVEFVRDYLAACIKHIDAEVCACG